MKGDENAAQRRWMRDKIGVRHWYRTVLVCGLFPMTAGTAIFVAWLLTDLDVLEILGMVLICIGIALVVLGIVGLAIFISRARNEGLPYGKPVCLGAALLFLNFPLCAAFVSIAFAMESAHVVTVVDRATAPIEDLTFTDPAGQQHQIEPIRPGEVYHACIDFSGEGAVQYSFTVDGQMHTGTLIGYLSDPLGSNTTLDISDDLTAKASAEFQRISAASFFQHCILG